MEFEIDRIEMLEAAKNAAKVAPVRASIDVLNCVLIESDDTSSEIILTATNFEAAIQQKIKASVSNKGSMLVNSRLLVNILSLLPDEYVTFYADTPNILKVMSGKCTYEIKCLLSEDYPRPIIPFPEDTIKISGICSLAERTVFAVSKDDSKPIFQCVLVRLRKNSVQAAACDGVRMMLVKNNSESHGNEELLLHGHSLQLLASISKDDDVFEVADMGNEFVFTKSNMMFMMKKVAGNFVDVNMIIKSIQPAYFAMANSKHIKESLELILIGAGTQPVRLNLFNNCIRLSCDGESGAVQATVNATVSADTPEDGFYYNINNLCKLFKVISGKVKFEIDAKGMMLIKSENEIYLQLPQIRANKNKTNKSQAA